MTTTPRAVLAALVLLAACTGQGPTASTPTPSTATGTAAGAAGPTASAPASPSPVPTAPTSAPAGPGPCPAGEQAALGVEEFAADLDGDGRPDRLGVEGAMGSRSLNAALGSGATARAQISAVDAAGPRSPVVLGAADADGDGRDEVFVQLVNDAPEPAAVVRLVQLVGCELVVVTNQEGEPYDLLVGARTLDGELNPPAYELSGVGCVDADGDGTRDLVGLTTQQTGSQVDWTRTIVELAGGGATNGAMDRGTYTSPGDDAAIALLDTATCGDVTFRSAG